MKRIQKTRLNYETLYSKLRYKQIISQKYLSERHPQVSELFKLKALEPGKIREHTARLLTSGALAGTLLLSSPHLVSLPEKIVPSAQTVTVNDLQSSLSKSLLAVLPRKIYSLSSETEMEISRLLYRTWGITSFPKLGSTQLNQSYGLIGAEQHLPRFPGDTLFQHGQFEEAGITSGLGAWGFFVSSKNKLTPDLIEKEKYYVAVQTLYLPDWYKRLPYLRDWYKYRKVVVINPANGKTIICVVADAGPSWWTGKHFGGSPEVMAYLGLNIGKQKGPVVLYFVDDPENNVSLGPLEYNIEKGQTLLVKK